jgi:hypothetical protein
MTAQEKEFFAIGAWYATDQKNMPGPGRSGRGCIPSPGRKTVLGWTWPLVATTVHLLAADGIIERQEEEYTMLLEPNRVRIEPDSELARFLDEVGEMPVLLEKNGKLYRLIEEPAEDIWAGYDANKVKAALRQSAGALRGVDRDELLADIHAAREQDSHGRPA